MEESFDETRLAEATVLALGCGPAELLRVEAMAGAGSDRCYWRLFLPGSSTCVASRHEGRRPENEHFAAAARLLAARGVRVPTILAESPVERLVWAEDLGDLTLWEFGRRPGNDRAAGYRAAVAEAARIHAIEPDGLSAEETSHLQAPFDESLYLWEQDYFLDHFGRRHSGRAPAEVEGARSHPAMLDLAARLAALPRRLVHRDFQSQNILMLPDGRAGLVDFQGMRLGRPEYDLASLAHDPYAALDAAGIEGILTDYEEFSGRSVDRAILRDCSLQRLMQALGAYANLADNFGKARYLAFVAPACVGLGQLLPGSGLEDVLGPLLDRTVRFAAGRGSP